MKSRRASDNLAEGFEPFQVPPPNPDGSVTLPPLRTPAPLPPRICEAGPCINYHTFQIVMDAAKPMGAELTDGGRIVGDGGDGELRIETQHYCYPTVGVETDLGGTPVISCNKWSPINGVVRAVNTSEQEEFFATEEGQAYRTALDRWRAQQLEIQASESSAIEDAAKDLADAEAARGEPSPEGPTE